MYDQILGVKVSKCGVPKWNRNAFKNRYATTPAVMSAKGRNRMVVIPFDWLDFFSRAARDAWNPQRTTANKHSIAAMALNRIVKSLARPSSIFSRSEEH